MVTVQNLISGYAYFDAILYMLIVVSLAQFCVIHDFMQVIYYFNTSTASLVHNLQGTVWHIYSIRLAILYIYSS